MANDQQINYARLDNTGEDGREEATASGQGTTAIPSQQQPVMTAQPMMIVQQPTVQPQPMMLVQQPMMTAQQPIRVQQPMMAAQQPMVQQPMMTVQPMMAAGTSPVALQYVPQAEAMQFVPQPVQPQTQVLRLVHVGRQTRGSRLPVAGVSCKHGVHYKMRRS